MCEDEQRPVWLACHGPEERWVGAEKGEVGMIRLWWALETTVKSLFYSLCDRKPLLGACTGR